MMFYDVIKLSRIEWSQQEQHLVNDGPVGLPLPVSLASVKQHAVRKRLP